MVNKWMRIFFKELIYKIVFGILPVIPLTYPVKVILLLTDSVTFMVEVFEYSSIAPDILFAILTPDRSIRLYAASGYV